MDSTTKPDGNVGSPLRPPIFCPLCGSRHQFYTNISEQLFIIARLKDVQSGYRCSTEHPPSPHSGNPDCLAHPHHGIRALRPIQPPEVWNLSPLQVLAEAAEHHSAYSNQGCQAFQDGISSIPNQHNAHPDEDDPTQAQLLAQNSPRTSEASTIRLDEISFFPSPQPESPSLTEASMEHLDVFSTLPIPLRDDPDSSPARVEYLQEFNILPSIEVDPIQDQLAAQDSPSHTEARMENVGDISILPSIEEVPMEDQIPARNSPSTTESSVELLGEFRLLPSPDDYRRHSMFADVNIRRQMDLGPNTSKSPTPGRAASLPTGHNCWDEDQQRVCLEGFYSDANDGSDSPADRTVIDADDATMIDVDDADDNASVDSDGTVIPSAVRNHATESAEAPSADSVRALSPLTIARAEAADLRARFSQMVEVATDQEMAESGGDGRD